MNSIVQRIAADGSVVTLSVPAEAGAMRWFGATRVVGPAINRSFGLAQAGQHKVIPKKIFPGGRVQALPPSRIRPRPLRSQRSIGQLSGLGRPVQRGHDMVRRACPA